MSSVGFQTGNKHHLVIYQYICQWYEKGKIEGKTLNELQIRENFKIGDKYNNLRKIVTRIIEPCKNELDKFGDISFNYSLIRANPKATRGRGAKIVKIAFKFYETETEKVNSTYEPKRAAKKIAEFSRLYDLTKTDESMLGGLAKRYDLSYLSALEYENRAYLLKQDRFIEAFHKLILQRSASRN